MKYKVGYTFIIPYHLNKLPNDVYRLTKVIPSYTGISLANNWFSGFSEEFIDKCIPLTKVTKVLYNVHTK